MLNLTTYYCKCCWINKTTYILECQDYTVTASVEGTKLATGGQWIRSSYHRSPRETLIKLQIIHGPLGPSNTHTSTVSQRF